MTTFILEMLGVAILVTIFERIAMNIIRDEARSVANEVFDERMSENGQARAALQESPQ